MTAYNSAVPRRRKRRGIGAGDARRRSSRYAQRATRRPRERPARAVAADRRAQRAGRPPVYWLVLVAVLISAGNAVVRKRSTCSSNACLEIQWYLFSAIFLFCAGYTLLHNEHVRIDVIAGRLSRARAERGSTSSARSSSCCRWRSSIMWLSWPVFVDCVRSATRFDQRRRAHHLAGAPAGADRLPAADPARRLRAHQAHRVPARPHSRPAAEARTRSRRGGARRGDPAAARRGSAGARRHTMKPLARAP